MAQNKEPINRQAGVAVAEKLSALVTEEYLEERAKRADRTRYLAALAQVPAPTPAPF